MKYDFDEIIPRLGTQSLKYDAAQTHNRNLIAPFVPLWVADMDFACAAPILDAMRTRLDGRILGYAAIADTGYWDAVTGWMQRRFDWKIESDWIAFSAGVVAALYASVETFTKPGDEVLIMTPAYGPFNAAAIRLGRKPLYNRLVETDGAYTVDWADFEAKAARPSCKLFFLCSPQNPTGRVWTRDELTRMGEICFANDVLIVDDEIHADLVRAHVTHIPLAKLFLDESRVITCTSPSKSFNIAGNRHANIIIPDEVMRSAFSASPYCNHPSALSIDAAKAAYTSCEDWLEQLKRYLDSNFAIMKELLDNRLPQSHFQIPEGTYLGWVDLTALGSDEDEMHRIVSNAGVYVQFGKDFVDNGHCHARVNLACPRAVLHEGLERMCAALTHRCHCQDSHAI